MEIKIKFENNDQNPVFYHYEGQYYPQAARLEIDVRTQEIVATYNPHIGGGWSQDQHDGLVITLPLNSNSSRSYIESLEKDPRILNFLEKLFKEWDEYPYSHEFQMSEKLDSEHTSLCFALEEESAEFFNCHFDEEEEEETED